VLSSSPKIVGAEVPVGSKHIMQLNKYLYHINWSGGAAINISISYIVGTNAFYTVQFIS
jgi:hypothetical protein